MEHVAALQSKALDYKLKRQPLPPRDPAAPLRMTSDCTGYGSVMQAVAHLGLQIHCVQCSEVDEQKRILTKAVRKFFCCESGKLYYDLRDRVGDLQSQLPGPGVIDLHEGGYPCQSFSKQGLQRGGADQRGQLLVHGVEGILLNQPRLFFLENVADLALNDKFKDFFQGILACLRQGGYHVSYQVINARDHGLAQQRERVYIIGCRTDQSLRENLTWVWPEKMTPIPAQHFLKMDVCPAVAQKRHSSVFKSNLKKAKAACKARGWDLRSKSNVIIVDMAGSSQNMQRGYFPTITASRGSNRDYLVPSLNRFADLEEMSRVQGMDTRVWHECLMTAGASASTLGHCIGNAMPIATCERILARLFYAADILPSLPDDRWLEASRLALPNNGDTFWAEAGRRSKFRRNLPR